jgi:hypothetical protein
MQDECVVRAWFSLARAFSTHRFGEEGSTTSNIWRQTMFSTLKAAAVSALIGISAITAVPATAQESGVYLNFGGRGDGAGIYFDDDSRVHYREDRRFHRSRHYRDWARRCTPGRALDKAERMGVRRARVADVSRRTITVVGRSRGGRAVVTFARAPRCPVIG